MMGRADKGIILTTGSFTVEAMKEAVRDGVPPIELVDGEKLATLLEDLEMGLVPVKAFQVDERFFSSFDPEVTPSANVSPGLHAIGGPYGSISSSSFGTGPRVEPRLQPAQWLRGGPRRQGHRIHRG
jgi:hypothetical protein